MTTIGDRKVVPIRVLPAIWQDVQTAAKLESERTGRTVSIRELVERWLYDGARAIILADQPDNPSQP